MINPFFKNTGPYNINFLLKTINLKNKNLPDDKIIDIKVVGFFNLSKYILENLRELEFSFSLT